ncbi:hypothetical protein C8R45DRAFT_1082217 [Mycena sanguinolenta]|nr:hypothetical protein C8R45DRAFT_1082217 [Mycena sanguinolenta]
MGTQSQKSKRKKRSERTSGQRKSKKTDEPVQEEPAPSVRPRPRIILRGPVAPAGENTGPTASETQDEQQAVAALVALGSTRSLAPTQNENAQSLADSASGIAADDLETDRDKEEMEEGANEDFVGSEDDELSSSDPDSDEDPLKNAPVSSPAQEARRRKSRFKITFDVPHKSGATRELEVDSTYSFDQFLDALANKMSTRKSLLSDIAYVASFVPKTPKPVPKLLEDERGWEKLLQSVDNYISASKKKAKGRGIVKPFSIRIYDTSGEESKASTAGGKKGKKPALEDTTQPVNTKQQDLYRQLEQKYMCAEHDRPCWVLTTGEHYHLTNSDLAKWAYLTSQHKATLHQLPENELKITDAAPKQHAAKKALAQTSAASDGPPQWVRDLLPIVGAAFGGVMRNAALETPQPSRPPANSVAGSSRQSALFADPPSSGTKRAAAAQAPEISLWLYGLDEDVEGRGRHDPFFTGYAAKFREHSIHDLMDMEDLTAEDLMKLLNCTVGLANRLVKYAKEDLVKLKSAAKKARHS